MERKINLASELKAALDKAEAIEASLIKEAKLLRDSADELHAFQKTIDFSDPAQVERMTGLLTIAAVGNPRRAYHHRENELALAALVAENAQFARTVLYPRCQQLEARARAKVEKKLKPHFEGQDALQRATLESTELSALAPIKDLAIIRDYGADTAIRTAKLLLAAWASADAIEQNHPS
jgi:hypothetical protein